MRKEFAYVAMGIALASIAFFLSGLIPSPSISLQQDVGRDPPLQAPQSNTTYPIVVEVEQVPKTKFVTMHNSNWTFSSSYPNQTWYLHNPTAFKSEVFDVHEYRYVTIVGEYKLHEPFTDGNGNTRNSLPLDVYMLFSEPGTNHTVLRSARDAGALDPLNPIITPTMQVYAYGYSLPYQLGDRSPVIVNGTLTLSMYLTS